MGISFRVSPGGRRFYPPPTSPAAGATADHLPPHAAPPAADGWPLPTIPPLPWDTCVAARSDVSDRDGTGPDDLDIEPSFALNLFPDGYSISEPGKGLLLFLIGDDPEKLPYNRASKAMFSDIECGCLPQDILDGIPCKFKDGTIVCEVRDYRSFLSNGGDSPGDDFPKLNRVSLRLGTECAVKDLSSTVDASWTYHDQLIAESIVLSALQPRLNLDPTPCLERLCNSVVKKIDLGINKGRQHTKDTSLLNISAYPPESCKPKECITCEGAVVCIENAATEGFPRGVFNRLSVNCPSYIQINSAKSALEPKPDNTTRYSSTLPNSSTLCGRKQSLSSTPAPDHLLQNHEQRAQVETLHVDHEDGRSQSKTVLPHKRKVHSYLSCEEHERENCRPSNRNIRLTSGNYTGHFQKSRTLKSNKEDLKLGSPKELAVKVDQTTNSKDMRVQQQQALSLLPTNCPRSSSNTSNPCVAKPPDSLHIKLNDRHPASVIDMGNHHVADLKDTRTPSVTSCSASYRKAACKPHKAAAEPQPTTSKGKLLRDSTCLNQEINPKGQMQKKGDTEINASSKNRSSEEPGGTNSHLGISPDIESCIRCPSFTSEPDIEKILAEVILTPQRHGLNGKEPKFDGLEPSCLLPPYEFFLPEISKEVPYMQRGIMSYNPTGITRNARKIRSLSFHPLQYFCRGIVDGWHYTICLLESETPDDHQIAVETIHGDERIHISTLPNSHRANKFVDQFISLMKREGFTLCNDLREQYQDAPQRSYLTGEYPQCHWLSSPFANSTLINESKDVGYAFQNRPPHLYANLLQQGSQQWVPTAQYPTSASAEPYLWNSTHPRGQHYTSRIIQDNVSPFASGVFSTDLDQYLSAQQCQEVGIDHYLQRRFDVPGSSTGSYHNQWRQISTQLGGKVYQWDLPAFGRQGSVCPPLHGRRNILPSSSLHPVGSPPTSSDDGSVTSAPVHLLTVPVDYPYLTQGIC